MEGQQDHCPYAPHCRYWPNCRFPHPDCRLKAKCTRADCQFKHPPNRKQPASHPPPVEYHSKKEKRREKREKPLRDIFGSTRWTLHCSLYHHGLPIELRFLVQGYLIFDNHTIRNAVDMWCNEVTRPLARKGYGHISYWDTSGVTDMESLFADKIFNESICRWDVSNVTTMERMFHYNHYFNQPLDEWDVGNVTNMSLMFHRAASFNHPLNNWDVSNVREMYAMFYFAGDFNQPLNRWDVSNVKNMSEMFRATQSFNQNMTKWNWNVQRDTSVAGMFRTAQKLPFKEETLFKQWRKNGRPEE